MSELPTHTPYDNASRFFSIGLTPIEFRDWIEVDQNLSGYLAEKNRLLKVMPDAVWAGDFASEKAQAEVLETLVAHLLERYPEIYQRDGDVIYIAGCEPVELDTPSQPLLLVAARLVQEDLVLLRKDDGGWRMVAASVCFPSSWILKEKIGRVMHEIHAPVPGYGTGTRNAGTIERIFDKLHPDHPVERFNWSVYKDNALFHKDRDAEAVPDPKADNQNCYLRVERQTLRKLKESSYILFTIRIHLDPMDALRDRSDRSELGNKFIATVKSINEAQLNYKGLDQTREYLIKRIRRATE